jgi:orotidine-5'-phosphate decarboxylase
MKPANPIILALDFDKLRDAHQILHLVRPYIGMIKIGLELFTAYGQESLQLAKEFNIPIFLDLKLHDVPATVKKTVQVLCGMLAPYQGTHFVSIHTLGGREMCYQAWEAARGSNVELTGVTILTSLDEKDLAAFGFRDRRAGVKTTDLALLTAPGNKQLIGPDIGKLESFVCAPNQLKLMREYLGEKATLISPGIRIEGASVDDHKRSKSAGFALKNGATWLVIGRPITQSPDAQQAAQYFKEQADKY